jgi:hypothetical protein
MDALGVRLRKTLDVDRQRMGNISLHSHPSSLAGTRRGGQGAQKTNPPKTKPSRDHPRDGQYLIQTQS